ncbi:hypothetical protein ABVT39_001779, partial [Epinephelus coioides]
RSVIVLHKKYECINIVNVLYMKNSDASRCAPDQNGPQNVSVDGLRASAQKAQQDAEIHSSTRGEDMDIL